MLQFNYANLNKYDQIGNNLRVLLSLRTFVNFEHMSIESIGRVELA